MFPHIQIFLRQTGRSTKRLTLQLVLLCAVVAFFVVSLNLYANSRGNLQTVEETYKTIATVEIYGDVNEAGELVSPGDEDCVGRHWLSVEDYDLSELLALDSVIGCDLRTRVGAYIPGEIFVSSYQDDMFDIPEEWLDLNGTDNVIRFTLDSQEPLTISLSANLWQYVKLPIDIIETTNPLLNYPDTFSLQVPVFYILNQEEIRRLNRSDCTDSITLHPEVEYVMATYGGVVWTKDPATGSYIWQGDQLPYGMSLNPYGGICLRLFGFDYGGRYQLAYDKNDGYYSVLPYPGERTGPFPLQRYEDVKDDPTWAEYTQALEYDAHSFAVTLTEDITLMAAWNQGAMYLNEGRMITEEEYASGAKVCMISAEMADCQDWQVGDTLDMHLYACDGFSDDTSVIKTNWHGIQNYLITPNYLSDCGGFFEEDTYEIVGIFGIREFTDFGDTAEEVFFTPWNAIYIPANAASNAPEGPIQPSLLTIELKNGSIDEFKAAVEELGLTEQKTGQYQLKFSCFDQGYDKIQPGLVEMNKNAKLLLGLSAVLLAVTMILTAFLFSRQHRHSAGILRMLGGSRGQAFIAILACAAAVAAAGGILGTILGGVLTQSVGASILGDTAENAVVALHTGASPALTAISGVGCVLLFLTLTAVFTVTYIGKEPRQLLPENKG